MESRPQNPEFWNNPENIHPCLVSILWTTGYCCGSHDFKEDF